MYIYIYTYIHIYIYIYIHIYIRCVHASRMHFSFVCVCVHLCMQVSRCVHIFFLCTFFMYVCALAYASCGVSIFRMYISTHIYVYISHTCIYIYCIYVSTH